MKCSRLIFIVVMLVAVIANGQGTIQSITIDPQNPTTEDTIYVYADLMFPSAGCEVDTQSYTINGYDIQAMTHHCLGALTVICNTTDTFKINPLPAGLHSFYLTLTSGGGPSPCTPGIAVDDVDTIYFDVQGVNSVDEIDAIKVKAYPNPVRDYISFDETEGEIEEVKLFSPEGRRIETIYMENGQVNVSDLESGTYLLKIILDDQEISVRFIKE